MNKGMLTAITIGISAAGGWADNAPGLFFDFSPRALEHNATAEAESGPAGAAHVTARGNALVLRAARTNALPGERWIEAGLALNPKAALQDTRIEARLFGIGSAAPVASSSAVPLQKRGRLYIDLRSRHLQAAKVLLEYFEGRERTAVTELFLNAQECGAPLKPKERIPVLIDVPAGVNEVEKWPVTFGVPFAAGALWNMADVGLVDDGGHPVPCQKEITGRWAVDGAIQWLRFDALVSSRKGCFVEAAQGPTASYPAAGRPGCAPAAPAAAPGRGGEPRLTLTEQDAGITVDTGAARYVLGRGASPIREIRQGNKLAASSENTRGLYVIDQTGRLGKASADEETMVIESRGPIAACVRFEGWYKSAQGEIMARHITRVEVFAGQPHAKVTHTLVLTEDTNKVWFREIGWEFAVDAGGRQQALFGVARADWQKHYALKLNEDAPLLYMLQDRHYYFAHGTNHCAVGRIDRDGKNTLLMEGDECGDWAALLGDGGGALIGCREAARQHPKEFEIRQDRMALKLFSNRAGEELDFHSDLLVKKWGFVDWHQKCGAAGNAVELARKVGGFQSNAAGWSKTHEILVAPLAANTPVGQMQLYSRLHTEPVYGHADPRWIYRTEIMGRLHPRDRVRFKEAEEVVDAIFSYWDSRVPEFGEYGFMDYYGGPHISYRDKHPIMLRWHSTYALRESFWLLYARSGERKILELAMNSNRGFMDYYMAHHDAKPKIRGLYNSPSGFDDRSGAQKSCLPYPWDCAQPVFEIATATHLDPYIWMYQFTGYRRARDCILEYAAAVKKHLTAAKAFKTGRPLQLLKAISQAYGFTRDPELAAWADLLVEHLYDPASPVAVTSNKPLGVYYKLTSDLPGLIESWKLLQDRRCYEMALKSALWRWYMSVPFDIYDYGYTMGAAGNFLYDETGVPAIAEWMKTRLREAVASYDPASAKFSSAHAYNPAYSYFILRDIPYVQDLIVRSSAERRSLAAWVAYDPFGSKASVAVKKTGDQRLRLWLCGAGGGTRVRRNDLDLTGRCIIADKPGCTWLEIPADLAEGIYEIITPGGQGAQAVLAGAEIPIVLRAENYWRPMFSLKPPLRVFFLAPANTPDGKIFFEGPARLFDPAGNGFAGGRPVKGWVTLPVDMPGVWGFELLENRLVKVANLPPYFAFDNKERFFEAGISPAGAAGPVATKAASDPGFIAGALKTPGNQALYLHGNKKFSLEADRPHPSGDGSICLPFQRGTIEFFFNPDWSTFDVEGQSVRIVSLETQLPKKPWSLAYEMKPKQNPDWHVYVLYGDIHPSRCYRKKTVFEADQWVHIAWVWGQKEGVFEQALFVDGRKGMLSVNPIEKGRPQAAQNAPVAMSFGINAAYDELRVSDIQRYQADFKPPPRDREFRVDGHTRALFHFNGNIQGESYGRPEPVTGRIE